MEIEFDTAKDQRNIAKHGISLAHAAELVGTYENPDVRRDYGERRYVMIERCRGAFMSASTRSEAVFAASSRSAREIGEKPMPIVRPSKADLEKARAKTDWARIDAMSDEELTANAESDPDNPPLTDEELAALVRNEPLPRRSVG